MNELQSDYIQIGNEINSRFLHPHGHISNNFQQFKELLDMGITAVRANPNDTKVILHFAGIENSN
jgi:arabinogalactan endo-1,4-beta-galactosidase